MASKEMSHHTEDLQNQLRNIEDLIKTEEETARLNATTNKDVSLQALSRKRLLQIQKNQIIDTLAVIANRKESENEVQDEQEITDAIKSAIETNTMAKGVYKNEIDKQRKIIDRSKSKDEPENENGSFFSSSPGMGMGLVFICAAVGLGFFIFKTKSRSR